jgi:photosystem II stability/assembly factor-like uncharacterized protein
MKLFPKSPRRIGASLALSLVGIAGLAACMQGGPLGSDLDDARDVPVRLSMAVGKVDGLSAGLGKSEAITLQRLVVVFTSSASDTIRDTITSGTTPSLNTSSASGQTINKTYSLKAFRSWKVVATMRDTRDTVTHIDSGTTAVVNTTDTLTVPLTLNSRFVSYKATLFIPDSIISVSNTGIKDRLRINRIVLKIDGATKLDSVRSGYFPSNATSTLSFDYVSPGSRTLQVLAYGPLHSWDSTQALYSGSVSANLAASGLDTTVTLTMAWQGPTTGVAGITVTLGRANFISGSNAFPGTTGLPPAWTTYDLASSGYNRVAFTGTTDGWVVGEGGVIIKTVDAGDSWKLIGSNTSQDLYGLSGAYFVGDSGTVQFDSAATGICVSRTGNLPTTVNLRGIGFTSSGTAHVIGRNGAVYMSTNVTSSTSPTWTAGNSLTTQHLNAIYAATAGGGYAWVVGNGGVIRKYNGSGWDSLSSGTTRNLRGVSCSGSGTCSVVGDSGLILSITGGNTVTSVTSPTTKNLRDIQVRTSSDIVAVGDSGTYLTAGSATVFNTFGTSNTSLNLNSIAKVSNIRIIAVGEKGVIRYTTSNAALVAQTLTLQNLEGIHFPSSARGFAVGDTGAVVRFSSSSNKWSTLYSGSTVQLKAVFFTDNNTGWAVGSNNTILKTANGGNGWTATTAGTATYYGVYMANSTTGWAVGTGGTIAKTTNGSSWTASTFGANAYFGVNMRSATLGWAVGASGTIRKTTDGGTNWNAQTSGVTDSLRSVYFVTDNLGWTVGSNGVILKTTDGGSNWSSQTSGTASTLRSVYFLDANKGFIVGQGGKILKTTNAGSTWKTQYLGATPNLAGVAFGSATVGWAAGSNGTLMFFNP